MEGSQANGDGAAHDAAHDVGPDAASRETTADTNGHADLVPSLPAFSTRGDAPGLRGCWALNRSGDPCGAARRADGDYCNAHSGIGVAEDPAKWAHVAGRAAGDHRRRRAALRMQLGITRPNTPRGVLQGLAFVEAERIAARVLSGVLDPAVAPATAARLGLDLIDVVDPPLQATLTGSIPSTPEGVAELSLSQLLAVGQGMGIEIDPSPPLGSIEP